MKKIASKRGIILPLALLIMLLASAIILNFYNFSQVETYTGNNLAVVAKREADNALLYGIWAANTSQETGGKKCVWGKRLQTEYETTNEDGNRTTFGEYTIRRFVTFSGTTDESNATLTGIGRLYKSGKLVSEKMVSINLNMLFSGTPDVFAETPCDAIMIEAHKETYKEIKKPLSPVYIPPEPDDPRTGPNMDKCAPIMGRLTQCTATIYNRVSCEGDYFSLVCRFPVKGYIQIHKGEVEETAKTASGATAKAKSDDIIATLNETKITSEDVKEVGPDDVLRIENIGENFAAAESSLHWSKALLATDYDAARHVKYTSSFTRDYGWVKYIHAFGVK